MTYYHKYKFSTADIAGAIAEAALEDLRVNRYGFDGFPQISITENSEGRIFMVKLSFNEHSTCEAKFDINLEEAKSAVKKFKSRSGYDQDIFKRVQIALAAVERKALDAGRDAIIEKV